MRADLWEKFREKHTEALTRGAKPLSTDVSNMTEEQKQTISITGTALEVATIELEVRTATSLGLLSRELGVPIQKVLELCAEELSLAA